jgi:hypothetical protein
LALPTCSSRFNGHHEVLDVGNAELTCQGERLSLDS